MTNKKMKIRNKIKYEIKVNCTEWIWNTACDG